MLWLAPAVVLPESMTILVINGVAFWAYLQLSWLVLARVTVVTHRRNADAAAVVILAGWLQFGNEIILNACGIALECGAALYGRLSRPPPPPPLRP